MNIIAQLKKAERKLEKEVHHAGTELTKIRNAIVALGHKVEKKVAKPTRKRQQHAQSAKTRRKIAAAQKARWAKIRAGKKAS